MPVQGLEPDVLRFAGFVGEGSLDCVEIMGSNGDQGSLARQVLVEFILKTDERVVGSLGKLDAAKDGTRDEGSNCGRLLRYDDVLHLVFGDIEYAVRRRGLLAAEDVQTAGEAFEA